MFDWKDIEQFGQRTGDADYVRITIPQGTEPAFRRATEPSGHYFEQPVQVLGDATRFRYPPRTAQNDFIHQVVDVGPCRVVGWRTLATDTMVYNDEFSGSEAMKRVVQEGTSGYFEGFMLEPYGNPIQGHALYVLDAKETLHLAGNSYFVGSLEPSNYGSFLLRTLPKLLHIRHLIKPEDNLVLSTEYPWVGQFMSLLGIRAKVVNLPRKAVKITMDRGLLVTSSYNEGFLARATLTDLRTLIADVPAGQHKKVWVSRRFRAKQAPNYRPLTNEAELVELAKAHGFVEVEMENLSLSDQISVMKGARVIAGPSGSGLLNTIFAEAGAQIIELESFTHCIRQHGKVYSSCGHSYVEVFGEFDPEDKRDQVTKRWKISHLDLRSAVMTK